MGGKTRNSYSKDKSDQMIFQKTKFDGCYIIEIEKIKDDRGFFARSWDEDIFSKSGLNTKVTQCNISYNKNKGTIRGLHYQDKPYEEAKLVRCTNGKAYEVFVDIRKNSDTYLEWQAIELNAQEHNILYVPEGFALGFQTLANDTEIFYQMSQKYSQDYSRGIRWDDPKLKINWPLKPTIISSRDRSFQFL